MSCVTVGSFSPRDLPKLDALQMSPSTLAVKFKELTVDDVPVVMIRTEKLSIV